jgi:ribosomal protein S18 acetylase RimI-like enzyme
MSTSASSFTITPVRSQEDLSSIITLFHAYAKSLGFDLAFQNFDAEIANMPGKYTPPNGELLLARNDAGLAIGCVGLRPLPSATDAVKVCEMKRLYVSPEGRGAGVGRELAEAVIKVAEDVGYGEMRLDTLPSMTAALAMYRSFGFEDIPAYYETPLTGTHFLSLRLPMRRDGRQGQKIHQALPVLE